MYLRLRFKGLNKRRINFFLLTFLEKCSDTQISGQGDHRFQAVAHQSQACPARKAPALSPVSWLPGHVSGEESSQQWCRSPFRAPLFSQEPGCRRRGKEELGRERERRGVSKLYSELLSSRALMKSLHSLLSQPAHSLS